MINPQDRISINKKIIRDAVSISLVKRRARTELSRPIGEPGAASHASVGVIDAIHLPLSSEHAITAALGLTIGPKSHMTCSPDQFHD
jgi:hypothetical protein